MTIFQKNLQFFMKECNLKAAKLAEETGISSKTISRYYHGEHQPTPDNLIKLAKRFECSVEDFWSFDFQNPNPMQTRRFVRLPEIDKKAFIRFEGIRLHAYYLKESSTTEMYEGVLEFDQIFDHKRLYLHGHAETGHSYDLKLVLEDHDSIFIYGIGSEDDIRFFIALHYPLFREEEKKYRGGVGILTRLDGKKEYVGQRVILSDEVLPLADLKVKKQLLKLLLDENDIPRVWVNARVNNDFRSGKWLENNDLSI